MAYQLSEYTALLETLKQRGYKLLPVRSYFEEEASEPVVYLRHDVDRLPERALSMAREEKDLGALATYYFRCDSAARFPQDEILKISSLGHEAGYHYETIVRASGDLERARELFESELDALREITGVVTVAAHGSPFSDHSNMGYSDSFDYAALDLLGEPSIHFDFSKVLYITDTGGSFGSRYNVRDKVNGKNFEGPAKPADLESILDPDSEPFVLLSTHPERWPSNLFGFIQAQVFDLGVNAAKRLSGRV